MPSGQAALAQSVEHTLLVRRYTHAPQEVLALLVHSWHQQLLPLVVDGVPLLNCVPPVDEHLLLPYIVALGHDEP